MDRACQLLREDSHHEALPGHGAQAGESGALYEQIEMTFPCVTSPGVARMTGRVVD